MKPPSVFETSIKDVRYCSFIEGEIGPKTDLMQISDAVKKADPTGLDLLDLLDACKSAPKGSIFRVIVQVVTPQIRG